MESKHFGISVQTDKGIGIWHSLYTLPDIIVPTAGVQLPEVMPTLSGISTLSQEEVKTLCSLTSD